MNIYRKGFNDLLWGAQLAVNFKLTKKFFVDLGGRLYMNPIYAAEEHVAGRASARSH